MRKCIQGRGRGQGQGIAAFLHGLTCMRTWKALNFPPWMGGISMARACWIRPARIIIIRPW